jgi:hypothetical protein
MNSSSLNYPRMARPHQNPNLSNRGRGASGKAAPEMEMKSRGRGPAIAKPRDPFRPNIANPKMGGKDADMMTSSTMGKQLVPLSDGKREYRLPNKRQGFAGIARMGRMDQNVGVGERQGEEA